MTSAAPPVDERVRRVGLLSVLLSRPEIGAVVGAILVFVIFAIWAGGSGFLTMAGTATYLEVAAQVGIVASAVALLMIAGEFDLSVGSVVGAAGMVVAIGIGELGLPPTVAILLAFAFALLVGFINGYLVVRTRLPSFIVTLGMLFILRGLTIGITRAMTGRTQVGGLSADIANDPLTKIFTADIGPVSVSVVWWLGLAAIATFILLRTSFGNWIFGSGGSAIAARNVGVPVDRVKIILFMATAASAALLATLQVLQVGSGDVLRGSDKEFEAIITAVIGGTLLTGGYGSAIGSVFGALTLGMTKQGIVFAGIPGDWYQAFLGVLLLLAVIVNNVIRQRALMTRH
ncbi:MAG TPA: ABC transporter permease [Kofleriaceae bacterium]|jgi:simple sugar transport system permease protein|nr:ABC transporter permease [Kofleriaceae bacterium]